LARAAGGLEPCATDTLSVRRHRAAARVIAATALATAASVHGAFGDRPDLSRARSRALSALREGSVVPADGLMRGLAEVARVVLALPVLADEGADWQLGAIAFADEASLRSLYDACLALTMTAVREAAGA
jgi:hypothetical protein